MSGAAGREARSELEERKEEPERESRDEIADERREVIFSWRTRNSKKNLFTLFYSVFPSSAAAAATKTTLSLFSSLPRRARATAKETRTTARAAKR